jgi:hypothetical protein
MIEFSKIFTKIELSDDCTPNSFKTSCFQKNVADFIADFKITNYLLYFWRQRNIRRGILTFQIPVIRI